MKKRLNLKRLEKATQNQPKKRNRVSFLRGVSSQTLAKVIVIESDEEEDTKPKKLGKQDRYH